MGPLWDCMAKHQEYYAPQVEALKEGRPTPSEGEAGKGGESEVAARSPDDVTEKEIEEYLESLDKEEQPAPTAKSK